jgi:hypothetical protein
VVVAAALLLPVARGTTVECGAQANGDGFCDAPYNTAECGFDGGDCCSDTCIGTLYCGTTIFACVDPSSAFAGQCSGPSSALLQLGNGECTSFDWGGFDTAVCGWDGGDCCIRSCQGPCAQALLDCRDPAYASGVGTGSCAAATACATGKSSTATASAVDFCACSEDCLWLGDCCKDFDAHCSVATTVAATTTRATSTPPTATTATTVTTTPVPTTTHECVVDTATHLGDGFCDDIDYNSASCGWDGGDCCASTCGASSASPSTLCGDTVFACADPRAADAGTCDNAGGHVADGVCDVRTAYNTAVCAWDGGDCCTVTCPANNGGAPCET